MIHLTKVTYYALALHAADLINLLSHLTSLKNNEAFFLQSSQHICSSAYLHIEVDMRVYISYRRISSQLTPVLLHMTFHNANLLSSCVFSRTLLVWRISVTQSTSYLSVHICTLLFCQSSNISTYSTGDRWPHLPISYSNTLVPKYLSVLIL